MNSFHETEFRFNFKMIYLSQKIRIIDLLKTEVGNYYLKLSKL